VRARLEDLLGITSTMAGPLGVVGEAMDDGRSGRGGLLGSSGSMEAVGRTGSKGGDGTTTGSGSGADSCRVAASLISI
jgi:hypothetical protein